jgi:hypothetical protein
LLAAAEQRPELRALDLAEVDPIAYIHGVTLERAGLIRRQPKTPRSIEVLVDPKHLPELI